MDTNIFEFYDFISNISFSFKLDFDKIRTHERIAMSLIHLFQKKRATVALRLNSRIALRSKTSFMLQNGEILVAPAEFVNYLSKVWATDDLIPEPDAEIMMFTQSPKTTPIEYDTLIFGEVPRCLSSIRGVHTPRNLCGCASGFRSWEPAGAFRLEPACSRARTFPSCGPSKQPPKWFALRRRDA